MGTETIYLAKCDRCHRTLEVSEEGQLPETWGAVGVPGQPSMLLLCDTPCLVQLSLFLGGANVRKPRTKVALGSSPLSAVPDAETP